MDHASRLRQQRQVLHRTYEAIHDTDAAMWPTQHPGGVLDGYAACLSLDPPTQVWGRWGVDTRKVPFELG
jgi:hypothetical protein